jgi:poly(hydroxyalkanoate) depolymerase family esterase
MTNSTRSQASLAPLAPPATNPGNLRGFCYVPPAASSPMPLVVVLHGCGQTAEGYDRGSGWSRLAEREGFALLFPEQLRSNNPMGCFNWFTANDSQRGRGEAASIKAMVDAMAKAWPIDRERIFVTGLSAGGAMASVMLAAYPDTFAGGAIIAGMPYGCASDVGEAFDCMGGRARQEAAALGAKVLRASPHRGRWPRISVWQGTRDATVDPANADAIVLQWAHVHGLDPKPARVETVEGYPHRTWVDGAGRTAIEQYLITGMDHGTPLMPGTGDGESGQAGAHMLDVAISSTDRIAAFFGIAPAVREKRLHRPAATAKPKPVRRRRLAVSPANMVQKTIEDALKAAGLLGRG